MLCLAAWLSFRGLWFCHFLSCSASSLPPSLSLSVTFWVQTWQQKQSGRMFSVRWITVWSCRKAILTSSYSGREAAEELKPSEAVLHSQTSQKQGQAWFLRVKCSESDKRPTLMWMSCSPSASSDTFLIGCSSFFNLTNLKWSRPRSKQQSTDSCEGDTDLQLPSSSSPSSSSALKTPANGEKQLAVCELAFGSLPRAHLDVYAVTSFSRLWAKRWLRKRSCPWGSRRSSRASTRSLFSSTWRELRVVKAARTKEQLTICSFPQQWWSCWSRPSRPSLFIVPQKHSSSDSRACFFFFKLLQMFWRWSSCFVPSFCSDHSSAVAKGAT